MFFLFEGARNFFCVIGTAGICRFVLSQKEAVILLTSQSLFCPMSGLISMPGCKLPKCVTSLSYPYGQSLSSGIDLNKIFYIIKVKSNPSFRKLSELRCKKLAFTCKLISITFG